MPKISQDLRAYLDGIRSSHPLRNYIPRKSTATSLTGEVALDEYRFRGSLRNREPELREILHHPRLLILAEPGGGKSVVAEAAIQETIGLGRVPALIELKEFRGSLLALLQAKVPKPLLPPEAKIRRTYIMDGTDELPAELTSKFSSQLAKLLASDPSAHLILTSRQAFYVSQRERLKLPDLTAVFHLLDLDNADIRRYASGCCLNVDKFGLH